ncbi:MAG TPA: hypothetical protein VLC46_16380 [Thermoanaerobaculia bacterium]|jgi:hypothetical protein|nr:hypothetical protein [Thermoanaerobaculia bacterium]
MNRTAVIIAALVLFLTSSAIASQPAGSFQWVTTVYADLPSAAAGLAAGASDPLPPVLIETSDPQIPFVVFRWEFADLVAAPPNLVYFVGDENRALKTFKEWRLTTTRKAGLVTTGDENIAVVWMTR